MPRVRSQKTSFSGGEISPQLLGRDDLRAFDNGARTLRNVFIRPTGGVTRRHGLRFVDVAAGPGRLIAFEFNTEQVYLLVLSEGRVDVYRDGIHVAAVPAPWSYAQLRQINWTQSADTLLIVHPDVPPKKITRTSDSDWHLTDWTYHTDNERILPSALSVRRCLHHLEAECDDGICNSYGLGSDIRAKSRRRPLSAERQGSADLIGHLDD